jgi:hypothetical protein
LISQQEVCIKVSAVNWNQFKLVNCIKMKSHFSNSHMMWNTCALLYVNAYINITQKFLCNNIMNFQEVDVKMKVLENYVNLYNYPLKVHY